MTCEAANSPLSRGGDAKLPVPYPCSAGHTRTPPPKEVPLRAKAAAFEEGASSSSHLQLHDYGVLLPTSLLAPRREF